MAQPGLEMVSSSQDLHPTLPQRSKRVTGRTGRRGKAGEKEGKSLPHFVELNFFLLFNFFFLFCFSGLHPQHMEVPRLGFKSELWQPAYTTATATPDPSRIFVLHHSSRQCWILNPLREVRD